MKQDTSFPECTHARAWLAHGACKFYKRKRSYIYIYIFKATSAPPRAGTTGREKGLSPSTILVITYMCWNSAKRPLRQSDRSDCALFKPVLLLQNPQALLDNRKIQVTGHNDLTQGEPRGRLSNQGQTPIHWAAEKGHVSLVELLITSGASVEVEDAFGCDPRAAAATKLYVSGRGLLRWTLTSCLCMKDVAGIDMNDECDSMILDELVLL